MLLRGVPALHGLSTSLSPTPSCSRPSSGCPAPSPQSCPWAPFLLSLTREGSSHQLRLIFKVYFRDSSSVLPLYLIRCCLLPFPYNFAQKTPSRAIFPLGFLRRGGLRQEATPSWPPLGQGFPLLPTSPLPRSSRSPIFTYAPSHAPPVHQGVASAQSPGTAQGLRGVGRGADLPGRRWMAMTTPSRPVGSSQGA